MDSQVEIYFQPGRMVGLFPTHHDETLDLRAVARGRARRFKADIEGNYLATLHLMAALAERLNNAQRATRILGMAELPSFFRKQFGPGWALVGDAATTSLRSWLAGSATHGATASSS